MIDLTLEELCWLWHHADDWMHGHELCDKLRVMIDSKSQRELTDAEIREIATKWRAENP